MKFLDNYNRLTRAEVGVLLFVLLTTFRICLLPATLSEVAGESAVYVLLAGFAVEAAVAVAALCVAARGGIGALGLPSWVKRGLGVLFALYFFFKVVLRTYEVVEYCAGDLFDHASPLLLAVVLLLTAALLAVKGFAGVARTGMMYLVVVAILFVLSVFFASFNGYLYNLWPLLRPHSVGEGFMRQALWIGDGAVFLFADIATESRAPRRFTWGVVAYAVSLVAMLFFYLNFVYTYGTAARFVRFAFVRMLTGGDPEELGAVDWPVMLIWLLSVPIHLSATFYAGCEGLRVGFSRREHGGSVYLVVGLVVTFVAYLLLFRDKDGFTSLTEAAPLAWVTFGFLALLLALGVVAAVRTGRKEAAR